MKNIKLHLKSILLITVCFLLFSACEEDELGPSLSQVKVCTSNGLGSFLCDSDESEISPASPTIYATCILEDAEEDTNVTFSWYGWDGSTFILIDAASVRAGDIGSGPKIDVRSFLNSPTNGWPSGDYKVVISLDTDDMEEKTKSFSVF